MTDLKLNLWPLYHGSIFLQNFLDLTGYALSCGMGNFKFCEIWFSHSYLSPLGSGLKYPRTRMICQERHFGTFVYKSPSSLFGSGGYDNWNNYIDCYFWTFIFVCEPCFGREGPDWKNLQRLAVGLGTVMALMWLIGWFLWLIGWFFWKTKMPDYMLIRHLVLWGGSVQEIGTRDQYKRSVQNNDWQGIWINISFSSRGPFERPSWGGLVS